MVTVLTIGWIIFVGAAVKKTIRIKFGMVVALPVKATPMPKSIGNLPELLEGIIVEPRVFYDFIITYFFRFIRQTE